MAYLHCHTKNCHWSQDDFWDWKWTWKIWKSRPFGYNPISLMIDDVRLYIKPRYIRIERNTLKEITGKFGNQIFSWRLMIHELSRHFSRIKRQKYWTFKDFKKVRDVAVCPKCGMRNWDID